MQAGAVNKNVIFGCFTLRKLTAQPLEGERQSTGLIYCVVETRTS